MKNTLLIACSFLTLPLLSDDTAFSFWGDGAFYRRAEGNNRRLIIDEGGGKLNPCGGCNFHSCETKKLVRDFHYEPGFETGIRYTTRHSIFEAKYLWIRQWESSCHKSDIGLLYFSEDHPDLTVDFSGADHAHAIYQSQFQNGEINYYWFISPRHENYFSAGWLFGIRYEDIGEHIDVEFQNGSDKSPYRVHVWNRLPVIQTGGELGWNPTTYLSWDLTLKIGLGFDWYRQHTYLGDQNNTVTLLNYEASGFSTPFVAEAALAFTYQPWRFINIHAAYSMIYLNGVALAPDQIHKSLKHQTADAIGSPIYHGWTAGVTFSF
jgi:hypothetical protein